MSVAGEGIDTESTETTEPETEEPESPSAGSEPSADPPKQTRRERQEERAARHRELETLRSEVGRERDSRAQLEAQVAELRGYLQAQGERQQQTQQQSEHEKELSRLDDEAKRHLMAVANAKTPELADRELGLYHAAMRKAAALEARAAWQTESAANRASMPNPEVLHADVQLRTEFSWLGTDPVATAAAAAIENQMIASGKPNSLATSRAAAAEAAKRLGIGGQSNGTTPQQRAAFTGIRSGEGGSNSNAPRQQLDANNLPPWAKKAAEATYGRMGHDLKTSYKMYADYINKHQSKKDE